MTAKKPAPCAAFDIARKFSQLTIQPVRPVLLTHNVISQPNLNTLVQPEFMKPTASATQVRTVTKYSMRSGKRKTVKAVLKRFKRLDWGVWVRTKSSRFKRLWRKRGQRIYRLRQHVFCNGKQNWLLDSMVTPMWRRPRHYVDDPYAPYHKREEFSRTRTKPIEWDL